jgi:hypothetical protein
MSIKMHFWTRTCCFPDKFGRSEWRAGWASSPRYFYIRKALPGPLGRCHDGRLLLVTTPGSTERRVHAAVGLQAFLKYCFCAIYFLCIILFNNCAWSAIIWLNAC